MGVKNTLTVESGVHDWPYWRRVLPAFTRDIAARLAPGARASSGVPP